MSTFGTLVFEPRFSDELERQYCMIHIKHREHTLARSWYLLGSAFWVLAIALAWSLAYDEPTKRILIPAAIVMAVLSIAGFRFVKSTRVLRLGQLIGFSLSNIIMLMVARADLLDGVGNRGVAGLWIVGSSTALGLIAYRNYVHIVAVVLFLSALALGLKDYPEPLMGWGFGALLALGASNAQIFSHRAFKLDAIRSFRAQSICTPKQVLMHAVETQRSVSEVFGPEDRTCVCICSDWRDYQTFANRTEGRRVAEILSAYYTRQQRLLEQAFPEGNYFLDWIADELFAVAFVTGRSDERALAQGALAFARRSLAERAKFAAIHGAPSGVDIGIALGVATVGMLGPDGNKKATALGAVAGTARRLQSVGKSLRSFSASRDRVVLHPSMHDHLSAEADVELVTIPPGLAVKDLPVGNVLVLHASESSVPLLDIRKAG